MTLLQALGGLGLMGTSIGNECITLFLYFYMYKIVMKYKKSHNGGIYFRVIHVSEG
jgi:hypothetical protein